jgi:hypothetical protein
MSEKCAKKKKNQKSKIKNSKCQKKNQKGPPNPPNSLQPPQIWHQNDRHPTLRPTVPISSRQHHARLRHSAQKAAALGGIHGTPGVSKKKNQKKKIQFFLKKHMYRCFFSGNKKLIKLITGENRMFWVVFVSKTAKNEKISAFLGQKQRKIPIFA